MNLDDNGCPTELDPFGFAAPYCPPTACKLCPSGNPVAWDKSNFEWCQEMRTCAATIDWDKISESRNNG